MKKLIGWGCLVGGTWAVYHQASDRITPHTDATLVGVIAAVSFGCVAVQLIWTWKWRALSLGLLSFFLGTALLYTRVSAGAWGHDLWQERAVLSLVRSLYLVGAILTAGGLARWAWRNVDRSFPWWRRADGRDPFGPSGDDR